MSHRVSLGSVRMGAVVNNPRAKQMFMDLMREIVGDPIKEFAGQRPDWDAPHVAPEHERAGHG